MISNDAVLTPPVILTSPMLFAQASGAKCEGDQLCHWCNGPCRRVWLHDDPPPTPFVRNCFLAKNPSLPYICVGCWMFRRKRITINYLGGNFRDGQCPRFHPWVITEKEAFVINLADRKHLYAFLLNPPPVFCLSLIEAGLPNHLQLCPVNNASRIEAGTPLSFFLNNKEHTYTIYELEHAILNGAEGTEPGVQALVRYLGEAPPGLETTFVKVQEKRGPGRPPKLEDSKILKKVLGK